MTTKIPTNPEEALKLQVRLERLYKQLGWAQQRDRSLAFREALAGQYIRLVELMLEYKRARYGHK